MDSEAVRMSNGANWPIPKLAALVCFALACGILLGSLLSTANASPDRPAVVRSL